MERAKKQIPLKLHAAQRALAEAQKAADFNFEQYQDAGAELCKLAERFDELAAALHDAATSLETISLRSFGEERGLDSKQQMRGYAASRASAARAELARIKDGAA